MMGLGHKNLGIGIVFLFLAVGSRMLVGSTTLIVLRLPSGTKVGFLSLIPTGCSKKGEKEF